MGDGPEPSERTTAPAGAPPDAPPAPKPSPKRSPTSKPKGTSPSTARPAPSSPPTPSDSKAVPAKARTPAASPSPSSPPVARPPPAPAPRRAAPAVPPGAVVDATGLILGRAASVVAKRLLNGENIVVVNAELSVVIGERSMVLETYRADRARGSKRTGPHFPRYPDRIFRRTVRGMLPHLKSRGKAALDRLQVHIGVPPEFEGQGRETIEAARLRPALRRPVTLGEISRFLGARV